MSAVRHSSGTHKWLSINTIFLAAALGVAIAALVYAIKNRNEINDIEHSMSQGAKAGFANNQKSRQGGRNININDYVQPGDPSPGDWWTNNGNNNVKDGADASNALYNNKAQSQCGAAAIAEPYHAHTVAGIGAPKMVPSASSYASTYADETAANSLAGKTTYSCAPDVAAAGGCDYAINPDNLMPGSWREGVGCGDGTDPNSQWAKYHPTRDKYYRYITAAGSARLGVNTRSPLRKILGIQSDLRSPTSTPLSTIQTTPFNMSSQQADFIYSAVGSFPHDITC